MNVDTPILQLGFGNDNGYRHYRLTGLDEEKNAYTLADIYVTDSNYDSPGASPEWEFWDLERFSTIALQSIELKLHAAFADEALPSELNPRVGDPSSVDSGDLKQVKNMSNKKPKNSVLFINGDSSADFCAFQIVPVATTTESWELSKVRFFFKTNTTPKTILNSGKVGDSYTFQVSTKLNNSWYAYTEVPQG